MTDKIIKERSTIYPHAAFFKADNRGPSPWLSITVDHYNASDDSLEKEGAEVLHVPYDNKNPNHVALYDALKAIALEEMAK